MKKISDLQEKYKVFFLFFYTFVGWFAFSVFGYLPLKFSFPVPVEKQTMNSVFYSTGPSFYNRMSKFEKKTLPAGTINSLDIFNNNHFDQKGLYYDSSKNEYFYQQQRYLLTFQLDKESLSKMVDINTNYDGGFVSFQNYHILTNVLEGTFIYGTQFNQHTSWIKPENLINYRSYYGGQSHFKYQEITEFLETSEKESISMKELCSILQLVRNRILLGWYPESKTAVFLDKNGNQYTLVTYKIGDKEPKSYGPYEFSDTVTLSRYDKENCLLYDTGNHKISKLNFVKNETTVLREFPEDTVNFSYRIREDGRYVLVGYAWNE